MTTTEYLDYLHDKNALLKKWHKQGLLSDDELVKKMWENELELEQVFCPTCGREIKSIDHKVITDQMGQCPACDQIHHDSVMDNIDEAEILEAEGRIEYD